MGCGFEAVETNLKDRITWLQIGCIESTDAIKVYDLLKVPADQHIDAFDRCDRCAGHLLYV